VRGTSGNVSIWDASLHRTKIVIVASTTIIVAIVAVVVVVSIITIRMRANVADRSALIRFVSIALHLVVAAAHADQDPRVHVGLEEAQHRGRKVTAAVKTDNAKGNSRISRFKTNKLTN
jgi:hypothetical protein